MQRKSNATEPMYPRAASSLYLFSTNWPRTVELSFTSFNAQVALQNGSDEKEKKKEIWFDINNKSGTRLEEHGFDINSSMPNRALIIQGYQSINN